MANLFLNYWFRFQGALYPKEICLTKPEFTQVKIELSMMELKRNLAKICTYTFPNVHGYFENISYKMEKNDVHIIIYNDHEKLILFSVMQKMGIIEATRKFELGAKFLLKEATLIQLNQRLGPFITEYLSECSRIREQLDNNYTVMWAPQLIQSTSAWMGSSKSWINFDYIGLTDNTIIGFSTPDNSSVNDKISLQQIKGVYNQLKLNDENIIIKKNQKNSGNLIISIDHFNQVIAQARAESEFK